MLFKKKSFVLFVVFIISSFTIWSQNNFEKILSEAKSLPKSEQPAFLTKSAESFFRKDLTIADSLCNLALEIAIEINNDTLVARSHKYLAFINRNLGYFNKALTHAVESNVFYLQVKDSMEAGFTYSLVGSVNSSLGNKENALSAFINSEKIYLDLLKTNPQNIPIVHRLAILYNDMGLFFFKLLEDYDKAGAYFLKGLKLKEEMLEDSMLETSLLANLGMVYFKQQRESEALEYYTRALKMAEKQNNIMFAANINNNIGLIMEGRGDYLKARENFLQSFDTYKKLKAIDKLGRIQNSIAYTYFADKLYDSAIFWYTNAIPCLIKSGSNPQLLTSYEKIYSIYSNAEKVDSALHYYRLYTTLKDSILETESEKRYQELLVKYETETTEKENKILKSTNEKQLITQLFLAVLLGVLAILILVLILYYRQHKKNLLQNKKMTEAENETLKTKLEYKNRELITNAVYLVNLNAFAESIATKIKEAISFDDIKKCSQKLEEIVHYIKFNFGKDEWKEFQLRFEEVHSDFYDKLNNTHPDLTPTEIKTCAFLRLNMSSKDIASLTNKSYRTVETIRTNIRKKMQLQKHDNLVNYLLEF